jgi:hypothetical protein
MPTALRNLEASFNYRPRNIATHLALKRLTQAPKRPGALHIDEPRPTFILLKLPQQPTNIVRALNFNYP